MTVLVSDLIGSVRDELLDTGPSYYTWSDATLERWLNDVLAAAANLKRDISPQIIPIPLVAGSVQTVPANVLQLLEPYFNVDSGNAVTKGGLTLISRRFPAWRANTPTVDVSDVTTDERDPVHFQVYPPNDGTGRIMALCGVVPVLSAIGCLPISAATVPVPDNYRQALVDGVCSKALGANTRRMDISKANFYWQKFQAGIMGGKMAQMETAPELTDREEKNV